MNNHLGYEDDVVVHFIQGLLENYQVKYPSALFLLDSLSGFLGTFTEKFVSDLWTLLKNAQDSTNGIVS